MSRVGKSEDYIVKQSLKWNYVSVDEYLLIHVFFKCVEKTLDLIIKIAIS